jgi:hypothetical protein
MEADRPPLSAAPDAVIANLAAERDALRVQAAAVAAQQAQLTEQETQLTQRRDALEQREQQIAAHLEERQRRLLDLREEIKQERILFETKKKSQQSDLAKAHKQADRARRRFTEARKRFKQRWLRYTTEKQTSLHQREQQLSTDQERLQKEVETYQRERASFNEVRLQHNGEIEISRRELKEGWQELGLAQQRWDEALNLEQRDRDRRMRALEAREAAVVSGQRQLAADVAHWQQTRTRLLKEIEGLDTRVRNLRSQLQELQGPARPAEIVAVAIPSASLQSQLDGPGRSLHELPELPAPVQRVACQLADQRWLLLEHWSQFLHIEESWRQEHAAVLAEVEATEWRLRERGGDLDGREQSLKQHEAELRQRQEVLARNRGELDAWQTRLTLSQANCEREGAAQRTAVEVREQAATALVQQLESVRLHRQARRRHEIAQLRQVRATCESVRQEYVSLLESFQQRQIELAQEQRDVTARAAAVERCRLDTVNQAPDSPAAEKRLNRFIRRYVDRLEAAERKLTTQRNWLLAESRRLETRAAVLRQREDELNALKEEIAHQQTQWEQAQIAHAQNELPRERELRQLKALHEQDGRQITVLRNEVERIARLLLDDAAPGLVSQAA